jgi:hypothetical protein
MAKITFSGAAGIAKPTLWSQQTQKSPPRIDITQRRLDNEPTGVKISCFTNDVG